MKKSLLAALCLLPLTAVPVQADSTRLNHLTTVIGDFQSGFVYWAECGNLEKEKASHPRFVANGDAAFSAYGHAVQAAYPDAHPQDLLDAVLKKTNVMKAERVAQSKAPDFCTSDHAADIQKTIKMFNDQSPKQMTAFLDNM